MRWPPWNWDCFSPTQTRCGTNSIQILQLQRSGTKKTLYSQKIHRQISLGPIKAWITILHQKAMRDCYRPIKFKTIGLTITHSSSESIITKKKKRISLKREYFHDSIEIHFAVLFLSFFSFFLKNYKSLIQFKTQSQSKMLFLAKHSHFKRKRKWGKNNLYWVIDTEFESTWPNVSVGQWNSI